MVLHLVICCVYVILQMSHRSSREKELVIDVPSSLVSNRTRRSSQASNSERFRTPLDSQTYSNIFENAPTVVERVVKFDTLRTTFIPRIFEAEEWADLFENFEDFDWRIGQGILFKCQIYWSWVEVLGMRKRVCHQSRLYCKGSLHH